MVSRREGGLTVFRTKIIGTVLLSVWFFSAAIADASAVRVALLPEVSIAGDVILLSHLIANPLPAALGASAARVSLGSTPQFGSIRRLASGTVRAALSEAGIESSAFLIPDPITVHRSGRGLSAEEVLTAIDAFLLQRPPNERNFSGRFNLAGIESLSVPEGELDLYVKGAKFDAALHRGQLSVASRAYPKFNAFQVEWDGLKQGAAIRAERLSEREAIRQAVLVKPGTSAQLIVTAADTQMILSVVPLREGHYGDVIRVRLARTTKFLNARVVAKNSLKASY